MVILSYFDGGIVDLNLNTLYLKVHYFNIMYILTCPQRRVTLHQIANILFNISGAGPEVSYG